MSLELRQLLEFFTADLALIDPTLLDPQVLCTLQSAISHMLLGVPFILELLFTAWTLPVIFSIQVWLFFPLLCQHLFKFPSLVGLIRNSRPSLRFWVIFSKMALYDPIKFDLIKFSILLSGLLLGLGNVLMNGSLSLGLHVGVHIFDMFDHDP